MVYLLHFASKLHHAQHYLGYTEHEDLRRLSLHANGNGARLPQVFASLGISFVIARIWPDADRKFERKLKNRHEGPRLCPVCKEEGKCKPMSLVG